MKKLLNNLYAKTFRWRWDKENHMFHFCSWWGYGKHLAADVIMEWQPAKQSDPEAVVLRCIVWDHAGICRNNRVSRCPHDAFVGCRWFAFRGGYLSYFHDERILR